MSIKCTTVFHIYISGEITVPSLFRTAPCFLLHCVSLLLEPSFVIIQHFCHKSFLCLARLSNHGRLHTAGPGTVLVFGLQVGDKQRRHVQQRPATRPRESSPPQLASQAAPPVPGPTPTVGPAAVATGSPGTVLVPPAPAPSPAVRPRKRGPSPPTHSDTRRLARRSPPPAADGPALPPASTSAATAPLPGTASANLAAAAITGASALQREPAYAGAPGTICVRWYLAGC